MTECAMFIHRQTSMAPTHRCGLVGWGWRCCQDPGSGRELLNLCSGQACPVGSQLLVASGRSGRSSPQGQRLH